MSVSDGAGSTIAVRACAFASTFRLRELAPHFAAAVVSIEQDEFHATFPDGGTAIGFDFGAVTFFDCPEAVRQEVVSALARGEREPQPPRTEELTVETRPGAALEVRFDRVVLPALTWPARSVVGLLLAQSAAMDYYEADVEEILDRTGRITRALSGRGRLQVSSLVRFIGHCIETKNEIVETLALFDKPDVTWDSEVLDRLFTRLREMLEIGDRFRALEYRLRTIQDSLALLVELSRGAATYRLEVMVVLLICLELAVMLWSVLRGGH